MKIIVQRVKEAKLNINGNFKCRIGKGIVAYVGITHNDDISDINYSIDKLINLRIFDDENNKLNLSVKDIEGEILVISNFTIYGNTKKGRRPSYTQSAPVDTAKNIYNLFIESLAKTSVPFCSGEFQEYMEIESVNDGPINLIIETEKKIIEE